MQWILGAVLFLIAVVLTFRVTKDKYDDDVSHDTAPVIPTTRSGMRTRSHCIPTDYQEEDEPLSF